MIAPAGTAPRDEVSEADVERACAERFEATAGLALVVYSAQNFDRLVTLYRAALRADRDFVMDLYTATVARATGVARMPRPDAAWPRVKVFIPRPQRVKVKAAGDFARMEWVRRCRLFPEQLAAARSGLVLTFRGSMAGELERAGCLEGASLTWSLWGGYLPGDTALLRFAERNGLSIVQLHSSGHAFLDDLKRLAQAFAPARIVPIHTAAPEAYPQHFAGVEPHPDGEWWEVRSED